MDLTTRYLGLSLKSPLVAGASPLTGNLGNLRQLEDLGVGAIVLPSIFEEQIEQESALLERLVETGMDSQPEASSYFPAAASWRTGPSPYLDLVRHAAEALDIPVIASLNGITDHGWIDYAQQIEEAGASALELNIYFIPADLGLTGRAVEQRYVEVLAAVRQAVGIPVAVKIGPCFSAIGDMARQLEAAGADGLVLFNRFYQPDFDLERLALSSQLELSRAAEIRQPLLWIALLAGRLRISLAGSTGVDGTDEVVKYLLAGADVVMTTGALLKHGIGHIKTLTGGLAAWLEARGIDDLGRIRGRMSQRAVADPIAFERANYIKVLQSWGSSR